MRPLAIAFLAVFAGACSDQACIEWSETDGACPTQDEAKSFMVTSCGKIKSVDSDGDFSDNLCCYNVTKATQNSCSQLFGD